ncbi:hypothetical protein [Flavobacterium sp. NRK1]|uniref:hypothetical protein n=1 Tax=Flavobacterium sp. NRK1 TaxID=2954929 RepID=UPI0020928C7D|nr:hypothetical protein [Flavobacterium sp. NRK1]MCO6147520.1 hypothetical protein [Flavobacterium sp. NRK1]
MRNIQHIKPSIDFGFGATQKREETYTPVTLWLSTLYNTSAYTFEVLFPPSGGSLQKISDYEYRITYVDSGTYEISMAVTQKATGIRLVSNPVTLTIY